MKLAYSPFYPLMNLGRLRKPIPFLPHYFRFQVNCFRRGIDMVIDMVIDVGFDVDVDVGVGTSIIPASYS